MHFDTDGVYTLLYTAEDSCGNETVEERTVEVISYRTVLYTDGTFIINEKSTDRDANIALHGAVTNEYIPCNPNGATVAERYEFDTSADCPWYGEKSSITSVEIGSPISPRATAYWFSYLTRCTSINLNNLDTSSVTTMLGMFVHCERLPQIDVSNLNTENVTTMANMFQDCHALASLDVSAFDTSNVTNMSMMFGYCSALTSLDVSTFDTSNVTTMANMFTDCTALTSLDVSTFDTSNVTAMNAMFSTCSQLTSLDVSSFDTSSVTKMRYMFGYSNALVTIYASTAFVTTQVTDSSNMFAGSMTKLKGGAGTRWASSNPTDKTYAHIDGGTSNPGYFTAKSA